MSTPQSNSSPPSVAHQPEPEQTVLVPLEKIVESKTNPRKYLDPQREKEIFESIKAKGVIIPLLVRPVNGKMEIVEGARRYRSAKAAGFPSVPSIVRTYTDDEAFEIQLISFTQRADIHPLDEANAYEALRKKKYDIAQISAKVGKERSYIAKRLQLVVLIDPAKKQLADGILTLDHALELARIRPEMQKEALDEMRNNTMTVAELREFIQDNLLLNLDSVAFHKDDATLLPKAGPCTTCPKRSGNSPDLFGDISKKGNHCLDRVCFSGKIDAFAEVKKAEADAEGKKLVRITDDYYPAKGKNATGTKDYIVVHKREANAEGIYVDGPDAGKVVPIRLEGKSTGSAGSSPAAPSRTLSKAEMQKRYKRRLEIFSNKIEQRSRDMLYDKLIARVKWPLHRKELELLPPEFFRRWGQSLRHEEVERVLRPIGLKKPGTLFHFEDWMAKQAKKLTDDQLAQLILSCILYDQLIQDPSYIEKKSEKFDVMLAVHKGVDAKKIHAEAAAVLAPKRPKPPKVEVPERPSKDQKPPKRTLKHKKVTTKKPASTKTKRKK